MTREVVDVPLREIGIATISARAPSRSEIAKAATALRRGNADPVRLRRGRYFFIPASEVTFATLIAAQRLGLETVKAIIVD